MSSNRLLYDKCAYKEQLHQSVFPGEYALYAGKYDHRKPCMIGFGVVGGNDTDKWTWRDVNTESDLLGITRRATECSDGKYKPSCPFCNCNQGLPCGCDSCQKRSSHLPTCWLTKYKPRITEGDLKTMGYPGGVSCNYRKQQQDVGLWNRMTNKWF